MTSTVQVPPQPVVDPESKPFWEALRDGRLVWCRCAECGSWQSYPMERCRACAGATRFVPVSGRGVIYSFVVVRQQLVPGRSVPYVMALVELDDGERLRVPGIINAEPKQVAVGSRVQFSPRQRHDDYYPPVEFDLA